MRPGGERAAVTISTNMAGRGRRHHPRRQPRVPRLRPARGARRLDVPEVGRQTGRRDTAYAETRPRGRKSPTWAACTCSAPSATRRAASTTSSAAARAARATRASRFYLSLQDDLMRLFATSGSTGSWQRCPTTPSRRRWSGASRAPSEGRGAQLRDPQEPPRVRRGHGRPAQADLRRARRWLDKADLRAKSSMIFTTP